MKQTLLRLAGAPPQVLLVEGGTEKDRLDLALEWAMLLNCPNSLREGRRVASPCGTCPTCRQIAAHEYLDLHIYDGRIANKTDEENPAPIRALTIDNVRSLKSRVSTAPHGEGTRVAIFLGLVASREEALNSLLKTLEDPSPYTRFVLLTPQRAQLLPTLVSRSLCLTLPWTHAGAPGDEVMWEWEGYLAVFLEKGTGFLEKIGKKGAIDSQLAGRLVISCQRALVQARAGSPSSHLARALHALAHNAQKAWQASRWTAEAQNLLAATVSPARVLEGLATSLYVLLHQQ